MENYLVAIGVTAGLYALLAQSVTLAWGMTGLVNLGLAGFWAIGAYASAMATVQGGAPVPAGALLAVVAGAAAGLVVTVSTLRLRDDYLAIVTLGFAEVVRLVASNEIWLTNGTDGISRIPGLFARTPPLSFNLSWLAVVTALVVAGWWALRRLSASPWGRALRAVRDLFLPLVTIYVFLAVTAGGNGRASGAVAGAYLLVAFLEATRFAAHALPGATPLQAAALREVAVGVALIVVLRFRPQGLFPERNQKAPA